jgi:hypothetical protein
MTIVREEENGNNGHHAGGVWRSSRCPSSLDTRTGALARFGRIDRSIRKATSRLHASVCACHHLLVNVYHSELASVSSDRSAQRDCRFLVSTWFLPG